MGPMDTKTPYRYRTTTAAKMAQRGNFVPCTLNIETLFDSLPADGSVDVRWQGFGPVGGVEHFSTQRLRRSADGKTVEVLQLAPGSTTGSLQVQLRLPLGKGRTVRTFRRPAQTTQNGN